MDKRIEQEIEMIRGQFTSLEVMQRELYTWIKITDYPLPKIGLQPERIPVAINFPPGYPGAPPYGIYIPAYLQFKGEAVASGCQFTPPFEGLWGMLSWAPDNSWFPNAVISKGSNMLNFLISFSERFKSGK